MFRFSVVDLRILRFSVQIPFTNLKSIVAFFLHTFPFPAYFHQAAPHTRPVKGKGHNPMEPARVSWPSWVEKCSHSCRAYARA